MSEKREQIEKALGRFFHQLPTFDWWDEMGEFYGPLADQAIVIDCKVEHESSPAEKLTKVMFHDDAGSILTGLVRGHHGREGKALAIIISLEEE